MRKIDIPIFNRSILYVTPEDSHDELRDRFPEIHSEVSEWHPNDNNLARTWDLGNGDSLILFVDTSTHVIAHGAFYALMILMNQLSIPLNEDTEEVYAHTLCYIINEFEMHLKSDKEEQP